MLRLRGKISQISIPSALVGMGLYGPRISAGASGFVSQVSNWLGPPTRKSMMQLMSLSGLTAPSASSPNRSPV